MKWVFLAALVAAIAVPSAGADSSHWSLTGSGIGTLDVANDHVMIGAQSAVGGTDVRGHAESSGEINGAGTRYVIGGQVICLTVAGNKAVAVYRLREPLVDPTYGTFPYGAVYIEDNGEPVGGRPVDRMADFIMRTDARAQFFCAQDPSTFFAAALAQPLASGNFVVSDGS